MKKLAKVLTGRFHPADAAEIQTPEAQTPEIDGPVVIDGVFSDDELTVSLRSSDSGRVVLTRTCVRLNGWDVRVIGNHPIQSDGICEVWKGETNDGLRVEYQTYPLYEGNSQAVIKRFYRHALVCSDLVHPNISPFIGVCCGGPFRYACIFESDRSERLPEYLADHSSASRIKLLTEVARGLRFIHDLSVVHGEITTGNIRVDDSGAAQIAGFSSATLFRESGAAFRQQDDLSLKLSVSRWSSPEILNPDGFGLEVARATKASDVYAFGMLGYEVFSGRIPFHDQTHPFYQIAVIKNMRPPRPVHHQLTDQLWKMIEKCWQRNPLQRPTIGEVVTFLEG